MTYPLSVTHFFVAILPAVRVSLKRTAFVVSKAKVLFVVKSPPPVSGDVVEIVLDVGTLRASFELL